MSFVYEDHNDRSGKLGIEFTLCYPCPRFFDYVGVQAGDGCQIKVMDTVVTS